MADRRDIRDPGGASFRRQIKLTPAIGDWTMLKPVQPSAKKVKMGLYGFDRLSQEELKLGHTIHYNFGQSLVKSLKANLSFSSELFSVAVEQTTYSDFLKRVYQPTVYGKVAIANLQPSVIICIDMPLANTIINHALGGKDLAPMTRKLTDIEENVLSKVLSKELEGYTTSFERIFELPEFKVSNSPELMIENSIGPMSTFISFAIEISCGDNPPGMIWLGYTSDVLRMMLERVDKRKREKPISLSKLPPALLQGINIPIIADLGETAVSTRDLKELNIGDIVSLDVALGGFTPVYLGDLVNIFGRPGTKSGRLSVRIFTKQPAKASSEMPFAHAEEAPVIDDNLALEKPAKEEYPLEKEEEILQDEFPMDNIGEELEAELPR